MNKKGKEFVVSVADFAFYVDDVLACTGVTNLSSSISVSMQEQAINAGKGNQKVFSYKYGRELTVQLEAANWRLEYIAMQSGSKIESGIKDTYKLNECITLTDGQGVISEKPIGKVGVELPNGIFVEVDVTEDTKIDLTKYGLTNEVVKATYKYNDIVKRITIDAESTPFIGRLVLQADKYNSKKGKVGTVEIVVPSYALDGNFEISFTPDGVVSTQISGSALSVEGDSCESGDAVYAYVTEKNDDNDGKIDVAEIVLITSAKTVKAEGSVDLSVEGIIGSMYKPVELDTDDVTFAIKAEDNAKGKITGNKFTANAEQTGSVTITATYGSLIDEASIEIQAGE